MRNIHHCCNSTYRKRFEAFDYLIIIFRILLLFLSFYLRFYAFAMEDMVN